jgi:hypothetical protein
MDMADKLARLGLLEPMIVRDPGEGLDALPAGLPVAVLGGLPFDGLVLASEGLHQFTEDEGKMRRLMHISPAVRLAIAERFTDLFTAGPPQSFKLTPRKPWAPAEGALTFRNASVVSVANNTAAFGWMTAGDDINAGGLPNDFSAVDIWVLPGALVWTTVVIQVADSPRYILHRPAGVDPGAEYTFTGPAGATRVEPMAGSAKTMPIAFKPASFTWHRFRVQGQGWPWRFWSAEVMYSNP